MRAGTAIVSILVFTQIVFAQGVGSGPGSDFIPLIDPLQGCDWACVTNRIINAMGVVSVSIVTIMVLYGGFQIITAGGDPEKFKNGRRTILYAAVGFVVLLAAGSITTIIRNLFS